MATMSDGARLLLLYRSMMTRCYTTSAGNFRYYGGRGIGVCDDWKRSSASFISWAISSGYAVGMEIDRINNDADYSPENCRWVTPKQNRRHRSKHDRVGYAPSSRFKGVYVRSAGKITAKIAVDGRAIHLGRFPTEELAAQAYDAAALEHFGEFAQLNFPPQPVVAAG